MTTDLKCGKRAALAKAITLIETTHPVKKRRANELLNRILSDASSSFQEKGSGSLPFRIGLSGPPGAGKSTFIETFGKHLTSNGHKVAVLAVDPSSVTTGGSILGDKTRMPALAVDPNAYIRPSPARGHLGGVTRSTNEAIVLCEAAGYDVIIVETVGVGQSEISVADMVDMFSLIISPAGGDELQALKKGIVEMCDMVIVNKSDGDLVPSAVRTQGEYMSSLKYIRQRSRDWKVPVLRVSSLQKDGICDLWSSMKDFRSIKMANGEFLLKRQQQQKTWLHNHLHDAVMDVFMKSPGVSAYVNYIENKVTSGLITPGNACDEIIEYYRNI